MSTFRLDIHKISKDLKEVDKNFKKTVLFSEITGVSHTTVMIWENQAPDVIQLLHSLSKSFDMDFNKMIISSSDTFPVIKLLKYYYSETKNDLVEILIIQE